MDVTNIASGFFARSSSFSNMRGVMPYRPYLLGKSFNASVSEYFFEKTAPSRWKPLWSLCSGFPFPDRGEKDPDNQSGLHHIHFFFSVEAR